MKREMKISIFRNIILCAMVMFLTSCSFFQKKEVEIASPEEVYTAVFLDDAYNLNRYLADGFPINYRDPYGRTLLMVILENNSLKSLDVIIERGVNTEELDKSGKTAIFYVRSFNALKKMVSANANINITYGEDKTSLLTEFIKDRAPRYPIYLIENGVDYTIEDRDGWNSIFWSVIIGKKEVIKSLMENGANYASLDRKNNYPIYYAYDENIILELLNETRYDLEARNNAKENILGEVYLRAVANGSEAVIKKLWELGVNPKYASYGETAMDIAKSVENEDMIKFLNDNNIK